VAFIEILVLWLLIAATIRAFSRHDRMAALLLVPYIAWVSFASCLCYSIWQRNPAVLQ
jgi:benzodiazapine receptor